MIITSTRDRDVDATAAGISPAAAPGDWGGMIFRRDLDQFEGRRDLEDEGIFLQRVNHAEIRYGGSSNVLINSVQQLVNPIQIGQLASDDHLQRDHSECRFGDQRLAEQLRGNELSGTEVPARRVTSPPIMTASDRKFTTTS